MRGLDTHYHIRGRACPARSLPIIAQTWWSGGAAAGLQDCGN